MRFKESHRGVTVHLKQNIFNTIYEGYKLLNLIFIQWKYIKTPKIGHIKQQYIDL